MSRKRSDYSNKKDVNVNTLFPANLLEKLDEWAWRNRMTRSAALRSLVEMAFSQEKRSDSDNTDARQAEEILGYAQQLQKRSEELFRELQAVAAEARAQREQIERLARAVVGNASTLDALKQQISALEKQVVTA